MTTITPAGRRDASTLHRTTATVSTLPRCDFDENHGPAAYDFRTLIGAWGNGCEPCWEKYRPSARLGTGYGQRLILEGSE